MPSRQVFRQAGIYGTRHQVGYLRGVAFSGAEFSFAGHSYPTQSGAQLLAGRGVKLARLATKWEYLQPTLGGPLDTTELGKLTTALGYLNAAGIKTIVEPHNYGDYKTADGVTHQLNDPDGVVTNARFQDYWTRVSTALLNNPAVYGYELMNEPRQMFAAYTATGPDLIGAGGFEGAAPANISYVNATGAVTSTVSRNGSGHSLAVTATTTGDVKVLFTGIPAAYKQNYDFHAYFQTGGSSRQVHVGLLCRDSTGTLVNANEQITGGFFTDKTWVVIQSQGSPLFNTATVDLQFTIRSCAAGETHYIDDLVMVPISGVQTAARTWEISAQAAVDAIRAVDTSRILYIPLYSWQDVSRVTTFHPKGPWIVGGGAVKYAGHLYLDFSGGGVYTNSYAADNASAVSAGNASLSSYVQGRLNTFVSWLQSHGVKGALTEIGWPFQGTDQASWQAIGDALYGIADSALLDVTYWSAGSYSSAPNAEVTTAYNYSTNSTLASVLPQATVIEAHPSL